MIDPTPLPIPDVITVYGAGGCGDCHRARRRLDGAGVAYRYVDLGRDAAAKAAVDAAGIRAIPIVVTPSGEVLVEPSTVELDRAIRAA